MSDSAADATGAAGSVDVQMVDASGATGVWVPSGLIPEEVDDIVAPSAEQTTFRPGDFDADPYHQDDWAVN
eukprot:12898664-Prorocentrum_lima.AAC.1